jgi:hypothetical protein
MTRGPAYDDELLSDHSRKKNRIFFYCSLHLQPLV